MSQGERWHLKMVKKSRVVQGPFFGTDFQCKKLELFNCSLMNNKLGLGEPGICRV